MNQMSESLIIVLKEMCNRVRADFNSIDFKSNEWYSKYEWTIQEEKQFKAWLSNYLYNNTKARKELMNFPIKRKKNTDECANEFIFNYGWSFPCKT